MREAFAKHVDMYVTSVRDMIEDCPAGGTCPINPRSMPRERVLQQKNWCSEPKTWQPGTSEGGCPEGKEEDQG